MSPQTKRLSHISMSTRDLLATEQFYVDLMGFEVAHEFYNAAGERYGFFLHCGSGSFIEFFQKKDAGCEEGLFRHICYEVEDIEVFAAKVRAYGITAFTIKRGRTDKILQFFFSDPDGVQVEIQQHDEQSVLKPYTEGH